MTYKSSETVADAVGPLTGLDWVNVIAVDNASGDGTVDLLRSLPIETIALTENGGFAHGCNVGWRAGSSPYVLFLNPDAQIQPEALAKLVEELDRDERIGAVAPRIEEPDGSLDYSLRRFPRLRSSFAQALFLHRVFPEATWVDEVIRDPAAYEHPHAAEWVSGACFAVAGACSRRSAASTRASSTTARTSTSARGSGAPGDEVRFVPAALAEHEGGASAPRARLLPILAASRIRYSAKHDSAPVAPRLPRERRARGGDARRRRAELGDPARAPACARCGAPAAPGRT